MTHLVLRGTAPSHEFEPEALENFKARLHKAPNATLDMVERLFTLPDGGEKRMMVPGSFHEFITRDIDPETGKLDLSFDSGNATGIFHMTR